MEKAATRRMLFMNDVK
jgi:hypothetical protein